MKIISFIFYPLFVLWRKRYQIFLSKSQIQEKKKPQVFSNQETKRVSKNYQICEERTPLKKYEENALQNQNTQKSHIRFDAIIIFSCQICLYINIIDQIRMFFDKHQERVHQLLFLNKDDRTFSGIMFIRTKKVEQMEAWLKIQEKEGKKLSWYERYDQNKFILYCQSNKKQNQLDRRLKDSQLDFEQLKFKALAIQSKENPFLVDLGKQPPQWKRRPDHLEHYDLKQSGTRLWVAIYNNYLDAAYMYCLMKYISKIIEIQWMQYSRVEQTTEQKVQQIVNQGLVDKNRILKLQKYDKNYRILHHFPSQEFKKIFDQWHYSKIRK